MLYFFVLLRLVSASRYVHWNFKAKALISCAKAPSVVCAMCKDCAQFSRFLELRPSISCSRNLRKTTPHVMADSRGYLLHRAHRSMKEAKGKWHNIFCKVCNLQLSARLCYRTRTRRRKYSALRTSVGDGHCARYRFAFTTLV